VLDQLRNVLLVLDYQHACLGHFVTVMKRRFRLVTHPLNLRYSRLAVGGGCRRCGEGQRTRVVFN
jgi:hypothetical protein